MNDKTPRVGSLEYAETQKSYVPKVGDKVRATLGESVVMGRHINTLHDNGVHIAPEGSDFPIVLRISDGWHFEQVVSVPTKFGAVIRRADGMKFVLRAPDFGQWATLSTVSVEESDATRGGFTVLFDGVDE